MCDCENTEIKTEIYRGALLYRCTECGTYQNGGRTNE